MNGHVIRNLFSGTLRSGWKTKGVIPLRAMIRKEMLVEAPSRRHLAEDLPMDRVAVWIPTVKFARYEAGIDRPYIVRAQPGRVKCRQGHGQGFRHARGRTDAAGTRPAPLPRGHRGGQLPARCLF